MATGRVPTTANSPLTAKGDLFTYSTAPARLAVGNNGETIVADSSTSTGLRWQGNYAAGKNVIINGDFSNWQRSTSATVTSENYFAPDRYRATYIAGGATVTWSRQTFTPGAAPVAGYEGQFFSRMSATSGSGTTVIGLNQRIEDVRTLAGQTATLSFWAKADSARTLTLYWAQNFGSGGSPDQQVLLTTQAITTSWTRYSFTTSVPSVSGKTIGTGSYTVPYIYFNTGAASGTPQLDLWGIQVEASNTATAFQTATGTIQGELSAAQRYYQVWTSPSVANAGFTTGAGVTTTEIKGNYYLSGNMRTTPTVTISASSDFTTSFGRATITSMTSSTYNDKVVVFNFGTSTSGIIDKAFHIESQNTNAKVQFSAEL